MVASTVLGPVPGADAGVGIATSTDGVNFTLQAQAGTSNENGAEVAATVGGGSLTVGGITFTNLSLSSNWTGGPILANLASTSGSASGSGIVWVAFSVNNFSSPTGGLAQNTSISATGTGVGGGTVTITSWADTGNHLVFGAFPILTNQVGPTSVSVGLAESKGSPTAINGIVNLTALFSLVSVVKVDLDGSGSLSFNGTEIISIPEPATIALTCFGVVGMLGYGWKQRKLTA